jgi:GAF domain-containing protein
MERFDALAEKSDERLLVLTGEALSRAPDAELQRIVAEVAEALEMPTALVSLVLTRTQYFRAQVGLPPDLANVAATDRDVSFCQFVVRDEAPLVVEDAKGDPKFPQLLVNEFGVRSYVGAPLHVGGAVVGSLWRDGLEAADVFARRRRAHAGVRGARESSARPARRREAP